jgi:hypothetical protein
MADATDMSTPVTRDELRSEIAPLATKAEIAPLATKAELRAEIAPLATKAEIALLATKAELRAAIALLATKAELRAAIAPLATKVELRAAIAPLATKAEIAQLATKVELELWGGALLARLEGVLRARFDAFEHRVLADLARHTNAAFESMSTHMSVIDEKYNDLPPRVSRLEGKVFPPERR